MKTLFFRSKVDLLIIMIPVVVIGAEAWLFISIQAWGGVAVLAVISIPLLLMFLQTDYKISGDGMLRIRCGLLFRREIQIGKISSVVNSKASVQSSPALSLDRIAIYYNEGLEQKCVLLSPKDKADFLSALKERNPSITIAV
jgi:hypothetical protein